MEWDHVSWQNTPEATATAMPTWKHREGEVGTV